MRGSNIGPGIPSLSVVVLLDNIRLCLLARTLASSGKRRFLPAVECDVSDKDVSSKNNLHDVETEQLNVEYFQPEGTKMVIQKKVIYIEKGRTTVIEA